MADPDARLAEVFEQFRAYARSEGVGLTPIPASPDEIAEAERALGAPLPESFRRFQREFGHLERSPCDIYAVRPADQPVLNLVAINLTERVESFPRLPAHLIAFSDSGGGDLLCFDTTRRAAEECPVVWWDHEQDEDQVPEPAAPSFLDWLQQELEELAAEPKFTPLDQAMLVAEQMLRDFFRRR